MQIKLKEPKLCGAGEGYVGHTSSPTDYLFFAHVDTCCALVFKLANGQFVGGHIPAQWGSSQKEPINRAGNAKKICQLMDVTRRNHVNDSPITGIVVLGDMRSGWGKTIDNLLQGEEIRDFYFDDAFFPRIPALYVDSTKGGGVDMYVNDRGVGLEHCTELNEESHNKIRQERLFADTLKGRGPLHIHFP
jgi:hypothetical protein